jgi:hypothetical protein
LAAAESSLFLPSVLHRTDVAAIDNVADLPDSVWMQT